MDSIASIKIAKDSTFAMLLEAQRRGHPLFYVAPGGLSVVQGKAMATLAPLSVREDAAHWYQLGPWQQRALGEVPVVLMRKDPPVDANYLHDTQILSLAQSQGALVVNDPAGLRDLNEKLAALLFPELCPATIVSRERDQLRAFIHSHRDCVLKPLDGMGGRSIFRVRADEDNLNEIGRAHV